MNDDPNIYYSPEAQGFTTVANLDQAGAWEFSIIHFVKRDADGAVFVFTDAGCSCPTPFEGTTVTDGTQVRTKDDVDRAVMRWWDKDRWNGGVPLSACRDLIRKVEASL